MAVLGEPSRKDVNVESLITDNLDVWSSSIKAKSAVGRGSSKKLDLYGIKKLRELILELAVHGLLVPQDPKDEPASELLKRIAAEKDKLVNEGKIKKQKLLPPIEEEEKPFGLQKGWSYVRFGDIVNISTGKLDANAAVENGEFLFFTCSQTPSRIDKFSFETEAVLLAGNGDFNVKYYSGKFDAYQRTYVIEPIALNLKFCFILVLAQIGEITKNNRGSAVPYLKLGDLTNPVFALAPLTEQERIVAKVDELMALCDQLEQQTEASISAHQTLVQTLLEALTHASERDGFNQAWARTSEHFDTLFTTEWSIDQLKQTILQLAVMGKLVPQNPKDEPASELLKKIAAEKSRLLKEGKIKKDKPLSDIPEYINSSELPHSWELVKFEDVVDITSGITKGRKLAGRKLITLPYLRVANVQRGFLVLEPMKEIEVPEDEIDKFTVKERDLLITEGGDWDKVGRTAVWKNELPIVVHQNHVFKARCIVPEQNEMWLEKYLNSDIARKYFAGSSKQTTNLASINKTQLRGCQIAIPPIKEQHRIVAKVDELMILCDNLKTRINNAQTTQLHLTDAMAEQALN